MADSVPFELLAWGHFEPGRLFVRWFEEERPTTATLEALIAREWEVRSAEARQKDQILFNGRLARYLRHTTRDNCLTLDVGPTDYRAFVGTNLYNNHRVAEFGWERFANPVGTTGLLISSDGMLVLGRRNQRVAFHGGYLHTIGGSLEAIDRAGEGAMDGFAGVRRELAEEVGITEADVLDIECVGLARDTQILQPELLFEVRIGIAVAALAERLDADDPQQEHTGLEFCPDRPDAIAEFLNRSKPVAPVATAALLLHGRLAWGEGWYGTACRALR